MFLSVGQQSRLTVLGASIVSAPYLGIPCFPNPELEITRVVVVSIMPSPLGFFPTRLQGVHPTL